MGATSGAETAYPSGAHDFTPSVNGVRVTRSSMCMFCWLLFVLLFFGHCVVFSSSIYGFRLPLWYLQATIQYNKPYLKSENIKHYNTSSNELLNLHNIYLLIRKDNAGPYCKLLFVSGNLNVRT